MEEVLEIILYIIISYINSDATFVLAPRSNSGNWKRLYAASKLSVDIDIDIESKSSASYP